MQPNEGVRFELRLREVVDAGARYALTLSVAEQTWSGSVELAATGEVRFELAAGDGAPEACLGIVRATLRSVARDRERAGYPRRIARWRPLPVSPVSEP